ncbi:MAG: response regulator [Thermodesulfobacteriota bacterium]
MKSTVQWLLTIERSASEIYREAAAFLEGDGSMKNFLLQLADDEAWHLRMLEKAVRETHQLPAAEYCLEVDDPIKQKIEEPLRTARSRLADKTLTGEAMIETIAESEFSEWNDIFVYVIDSLKHTTDGFRSIAPKIQHHLRWIEHEIEKHPKASHYLPRITTLPTIWRERILVVDDFPPITEILKETLKKYGLVDVATNGAEALRMALDGYYAVIVSDVNMPVMDGPEFYRSLSKVHPEVGRRFLFLSGNPNDEERTLFQRDQIRFLEKPAELGKIKQAVFEILDAGAVSRIPL